MKQVPNHKEYLALLAYSYILAVDNGGAPNVEDGIFTLAICKPRIRKYIRIGNYLVGIGGEALKLGTKRKQIIFIAKITEIMAMKEYAIRFPERADSIYTVDGKLHPNKFHCNEHIARDLGGKNVILSTDFIFFGNKHVPVPRELKEIIPGRGYQSRKNGPYVNKIIALFANYKIIYRGGKIGAHNTISIKRCCASPAPTQC
jgi:hypothetical protein